MWGDKGNVIFVLVIKNTNTKTKTCIKTAKKDSESRLRRLVIFIKRANITFPMPLLPCRAVLDDWPGCMTMTVGGPLWRAAPSFQCGLWKGVRGHRKRGLSLVINSKKKKKKKLPISGHRFVPF